MLCYKTCMISSSACCDQDVVNIIKAVFCPAEILEVYGSVFIKINLDCIMNSLRLFINFFQHEMRIAALFCCFSTPCYFMDFFCDFLIIMIIESDAVFLDNSKFIIIHDVNLACTVDDSRNIGSNEVFSLAQTDNQRIILLRADNGIRIGIIHEYQTVRALNFSQYFSDSRKEIAIIKFFCKMCNNFGICF